MTQGGTVRKPELRQIHRDHIRRNKRRARAVRAVQLLILAVFLGLWELAGRLRWIDVLLFSYPSKVVALLVDQYKHGALLLHIGTTISETVLGFATGTLIGTAVATLIWWSPFLARVLDPYLVVLNSMPKIALGPLIIVSVGPGFFSIMAMTLAVTVIITTLVVYNSFKEVDANMIKIIRLYGGSKSQEFRNVVLPASFPAIVSTLKVNVGLAWIGAIVGEFLVSKQGLGYLIIYGFQVFNFSLVIGALFIVAAAAAVMYQLVALLEDKLTRSR